MRTAHVFVLAVPMAFCLSCMRSTDSTNINTSQNANSSVVSKQWIVGKWTADNGTLLDFRNDGSFEQVYTDVQLAPGQVLYDVESAQKAEFTKTNVTTVGTWRLIDPQKMEIERQGIPVYTIGVRRENDELLLIGDGGRQDRLHRRRD